MIHELHELLYRAGARMRSLRLWSSLAVCWVFWAAVVYGVARFATNERRDWTNVWLALAGATLATALVCWRLARRLGRDPREMARRIEHVHPELGAMLLAALEQAPTPRFRRLGYLQTTVIKGAVTHGRAHNWADATSKGRVRLAKLAHLGALASLVAACVMLVDRTGGGARASSSPDDRDGGAASGEYLVEVQPGDAEIERGMTLLVIARFRGAMPPDAELALESGVRGQETGGKESGRPSDENTVRSMTRSLDDPQFVGRVPAVVDGFSYHVAFAGRRSPTYRIKVFEYPELVRADAHLTYPAYTRLEPKTIEDVRQVTALEGSQLTLKFRLNKDVAAAKLVDRDGAELTLTRVEGADSVYQVAYELARSQRFKLHLVDGEGRKNKLPPEIVVNVTTNDAPVIKIERPGRDVRVSPVEELDVKGEIGDDFGLTGYGLSYSLGGDEPREVTLAEAKTQASGEPVKKRELAELIDFESLAAEPDQLVSYYVWAEDLGPDGKPRRTLSDMYFAEVRPFDEVFRQGEQPTEQQQREQQQQGQQGAGQQAQELAELQKQIVSAIWKLVRRETGEQSTAEFADDAATLTEAQQQALDQLGELAAELEDAESQQFVKEAGERMGATLDELTHAEADGDLGRLRPALSAGQAAYQALLKLRARQFDVTQSSSGQQSGSSGGANSASQQQLQQLELSADENRYETQSRAQAATEEKSGQLEESREMLNRLRELARRQQDLNERLRELQSSLEAAETQAEREALERQLKRLRDQQREILRDAESLDNDMQNSANANELQEAREQIDETRSRVQEASEALDEGQVAQALAEGARAEEELNQLRDDFRQRTAERFTEEMRSLRDAARELEERQRKLSEDFSELTANQSRTLRESGPREELAEGLQEQQEQLEETLDRIRDTVTEAEEPEPLLAGELFDAVQQVGQQRTEEALDVARQLVEAGANSEAGDAMRQADRGIAELRERVDRAAESVLGDETEALRRADDQLRELEKQLNEEIQNARGEAAPGEGAAQNGQASAQGGERSEQQDERGERSEPGEGDEQQGESAGDGEQPGEQSDEEQGRQPGGQNGQPGEQSGGGVPGEQEPDAETPAEGEGQRGGRGAGEPREGGDAENRAGAGGDPEADTDGEQLGENRDGGARNAGGAQGGGGRGGLRLDDLDDLFGGDARPSRPITGDDFREWSERMRDVEDMLDDPELSAEAARIRDRAQEARAEYKRFTREPDWERLVEMVAEPLTELRGRIGEEIRRKESPNSLVPIDRDAAPAEIADEVRLYYQRLGSGE
jgi:hypothetical protein